MVVVVIRLFGFGFVARGERESVVRKCKEADAPWFSFLPSVLLTILSGAIVENVRRLCGGGEWCLGRVVMMSMPKKKKIPPRAAAAAHNATELQGKM